MKKLTFLNKDKLLPTFKKHTSWYSCDGADVYVDRLLTDDVVLYIPDNIDLIDDDGDICMYRFILLEAFNKYDDVSKVYDMIHGAFDIGISEDEYFLSKFFRVEEVADPKEFNIKPYVIGSLIGATLGSILTWKFK